MRYPQPSDYTTVTKLYGGTALWPSKCICKGCSWSWPGRCPDTGNNEL